MLFCVFGPLAPPVPTRMLYCKASCISACPDIFVWHVFCFSNPSVHISEEIFFFTSPPLLQICSFPPCLTLCCSFSTKSWFSWQYRNEFDLLHPELWPNMFINVFLPLSFYSLTRLVLSAHTLILLKCNWVKGRSMGILSQSSFLFLLGSHPFLSSSTAKSHQGVIEAATDVVFYSTANNFQLVTSSEVRLREHWHNQGVHQVVELPFPPPDVRTRHVVEFVQDRLVVCGGGESWQGPFHASCYQVLNLLFTFLTEICSSWAKTARGGLRRNVRLGFRLQVPAMARWWLLWVGMSGLMAPRTLLQPTASRNTIQARATGRWPTGRCLAPGMSRVPPQSARRRWSHLASTNWFLQVILIGGNPNWHETHILNIDDGYWSQLPDAPVMTGSGGCAAGVQLKILLNTAHTQVCWMVNKVFLWWEGTMMVKQRRSSLTSVFENGRLFQIFQLEAQSRCPILEDFLENILWLWAGTWRTRCLSLTVQPGGLWRWNWRAGIMVNQQQSAKSLQAGWKLSTRWQ